ncbi:Multidrug resistance ABC transporter ATP-binding and permease protein [Minicystis rosea]|nr:Multidrug resistance ABC transporter ATP-binding and permease protein [Minicystis rosea]
MAIIGPRRSILAAGLFLIVLARITAMGPPVAMKYLIDDVIARRDERPLVFIVLAVVGAAVFQQLTTYALTQLFSRSTTRLIGELRCKLHAHVLRLGLGYHDAHKTGAVGSRIMNDVQGLQNLVGTGLLNYLGSVLTSLLALVIMARYSVVLTLVATVSLAIIAVIVARGTGRVREIAHERTRLHADVVGRLAESLGGVRVVKAYRAEDREDAVFTAGIGRMVENLLRSVDLTSKLNRATGLLWGGVSAVVLWVGAHRILAGRLSLGEFFTFNVLLQFAVQPLLQIVGIGNMLMEALAGLERTRDLLREPREDQDPRRTERLDDLRGDVVFEDVRFAYDTEKPVLRGVSFQAAPGTVTALVGPSGSGKSTTIGLIASFHAATGGRVLVDGVDLATVKVGSYRAHLGVVLQESFLFAGTILENVAFACPDAPRDQILAACRSARVDEIVEGLPDGYDTLVGERGVLLSGGQRQRIAIARAILANPRILILDEATSSLDSRSEALIQEALQNLVKGRTTFVIAHRLSTVRSADQILVLDGGRIVERGRHTDLVAAQGLYAELYERQQRFEDDRLFDRGEDDEPTQKLALPAGAGEEPVAIQVPSIT